MNSEISQKEAEDQARFYADKTNTTMKFDGGKARLDLVPMSAVVGLAEVLGYGAKKYAPYNWRKGLAWSRYYAATLRHLFQWWWVSRLDPETGLSHLKHAMCDIAFLVEFEECELGENDSARSIIQQQEQKHCLCCGLLEVNNTCGACDVCCDDCGQEDPPEGDK